jgi:hypothetical protein
MKRQPNYLGDYCSLIRINAGTTLFLGMGHTARESEIMALDACAVRFPHDAHIYQLLKQRGSHAMEAV